MDTSRIAISLPHPSDEDHPRTAGVHVSKVLRCLAAESGLLDKAYVDDMSLIEVAGAGQMWWSRLDQMQQLRMSMGMAWEAWYLPQLKVDFHPGELVLDGIYMTHDGESIDFLYETTLSYELALHEVKLTYKSTNTVGEDLRELTRDGLLKNWLWIAQMAAYCKAVGTRIAYLHVLFVCGDYARPIQPALRVWRIDFTQDEIDTYWAAITGYVAHRQKQDHEDLMRDTYDASQVVPDGGLPTPRATPQAAPHPHRL